MLSYVQYINSGFPELPDNHVDYISFCIYFFLQMHNSKCLLMSFNILIYTYFDILSSFFSCSSSRKVAFCQAVAYCLCRMPDCQRYIKMDII